MGSISPGMVTRLGVGSVSGGTSSGGVSGGSVNGGSPKPSVEVFPKEKPVRTLLEPAMRNPRTFQAAMKGLEALRNEANNPKRLQEMNLTDLKIYQLRLEVLDSNFELWCNARMEYYMRLSQALQNDHSDMDAMAYDNWRVLREFEDWMYCWR